jgi:hypothetical protein
MRQLLKNLWDDNAGALIASEFLFVATLLVIGTIIGLSAVRDAVNVAMTQLGNAILALSPGYSVNGQSGNGASTDPSQALYTPGQTLGPIQSNPASIPTIINVAIPQ